MSVVPGIGNISRFFIAMKSLRAFKIVGRVHKTDPSIYLKQFARSEFIREDIVHLIIQSIGSASLSLEFGGRHNFTVHMLPCVLTDPVVMVAMSQTMMSCGPSVAGLYRENLGELLAGLLKL